ncbi:hypothetical protein, partial [Nakamurella sp.]|uniref:hypothetical protein n=1 Tax=Nakamurella sp. TaxID=1869182 RepID=UPI003B3ADFB2
MIHLRKPVPAGPLSLSEAFTARREAPRGGVGHNRRMGTGHRRGPLAALSAAARAAALMAPL